MARLPRRGLIMRWPYNERVDTAHAWGTVAAGIAVIGIIVTTLAATHANDPHFHWWWPTNWLTIPVAIVAIGLLMLVAPLRRHVDQSKEEVEQPPASSQVPQSFEQN